MKEGKYFLAMHLKERFNKLLEEALNDAKPTPEEMNSATRAANEVISRIKKVAPKNVEILLLGSVARGTQIRGSSDVDIFLLFDKSIEEKEMEALAH